ncbi:BTB/POZ domain-containing protein 6-B-like [Paramacrobiotus metropolitanus]|uniref:BTB/POZ domain-containing protein 6-B-like n=1 Tax=Paramacrobiotus metropolitanus TaxID=2943436 RepID=UPI00244657A8|nr:BTB/POZ domain-containing protein 6-B-like [Paramacrobiotus metropolitanus]
MASIPPASRTVTPQDDPASSVLGCLKETLSSGEFSDMQFALGRQFGPVKIFQAHKYILSMRSPVFRAMFFGSLPESCDGPIEIADFIPDAFANLLSYMYTDKAENLSADNVFHTMNSADKYDFAPLIQVCLEMIYSQLNVDNCLSALEQALHWHADGIVEKCLNLLDEESLAILQSPTFTAISKDLLEIILERETLSAEEYDIYLAVEEWDHEACQREGMDTSADNRRQMLGSALYMLRFPLLTSGQLADGPAQHRDIGTDASPSLARLTICQLSKHD